MAKKKTTPKKIRKAPKVTIKKLQLPKAKRKIKRVMGEWKDKELHSGSKKGPIVTNKKQAIAIALSEAKRAVRKKRKRKSKGMQ